MIYLDKNKSQKLILKEDWHIYEDDFILIKEVNSAVYDESGILQYMNDGLDRLLIEPKNII